MDVEREREQFEKSVQECTALAFVEFRESGAEVWIRTSNGVVSILRPGDHLTIWRSAETWTR